MFALYFIITSFVYTIVLAVVPHIIPIAKDLFVSWRAKGDDDSVRTGDENEQIKEIDTRENAEEDSALPISAFITVIVFFFQVASLIHIDIPTPTGEDGTLKDIRNTLFGVFNFRLSFYQKLCPSDDLTWPVKKFINVTLKVCSMLNLIVIFALWKCISSILNIFTTSCRADHLEEKTELQELSDPIVLEVQLHPKPERLSFTSSLKIGFIKLIKLNLTSISTFAFHMIHCVTIDGQSYLYLYAYHQCYSNWQYVILILLMPIVLLFPICFGFALDLLKEGFVSTDRFLLASSVPYYAFWLYGKKKCVGICRPQLSEQEVLCAEAVLNREEEVFEVNNGTLRWPVVQLYRNFLVVVLTTFVVNPIYRSIAFVPVFMSFCLHDRSRAPYKHTYLNTLQCLSSSCLLLIVASNLPGAMSVMTKSMSVPHMKSIVMVLQYVEITTYALMPLSLVLWKLRRWKSNL